MKTTVKTLLDSQIALAELAANEKIPAKPSYWIGRTIAKVESELKHFHDARVKMLVANGGVLNEKSKNYDVPDENQGEVNRQFEELVAAEVEIEGINTISIEALGGATIAPRTLVQLDWLITE